MLGCRHFNVLVEREPILGRVRVCRLIVIHGLILLYVSHVGMSHDTRINICIFYIVGVSKCEHKARVESTQPRTNDVPRL